MNKKELLSLKHKIIYRKGALLNMGLYPDVVTKILLKKITDGEWPEEARMILESLKKKIIERKESRKKYSMSPKSVARGLDPNR